MKILRPRRDQQPDCSETGNTFEKVAADTERDFWLSAKALDYGLVGKIISSRMELE